MSLLRALFLDGDLGLLEYTEAPTAFLYLGMVPKGVLLPPLPSLPKLPKSPLPPVSPLHPVSALQAATCLR